jgi:hypothetical protein
VGGGGVEFRWLIVGNNMEINATGQKSISKIVPLAGN